MRVGNFWNNSYIEYESSDDRNTNLSVKEYLDKIKPYLKDIIITLQKSEAWKIQLTTEISFISSEDVDEERVMHSKSGNIEFLHKISFALSYDNTSYDNANEIFNEHFESLLSNWFINTRE